MKPAKRKNFCVITGDIVGSGTVNPSDRRRLTTAMHGLGQMILDAGFKMNSQEIFRGDSFQLLISETTNAIQIAVLMRAFMRGIQFKESAQIDIRLGIGIGAIEFRARNQNESDGTAYRNSAKALDQTLRQDLSNVWIITEFPDLDEILNTINIACEPITGKWTVAQSRSMLRSLQGLIHQEIAGELNVSQSTITRSLKSSNEKVIKYLLGFCQNKMSAYFTD